MQPKYSPTECLSKESFERNYLKSAVVVSTTTQEPLNHFDEFKSTKYSNCNTAIWKDLDGDGKTDNYGAELQIEEFFNLKHMTDSKKRVVIISVSEKVVFENSNPEYCTFIASGEYQNILLIPSMLESFKNGNYIGGVPSYEDVKKFDNIREEGYINCLTYDLYGPPETKWADIVGRAQIEMKPLTIQKDRKIDIPLKQGYIDFSIRNIGSQKINFSFSENDLLEISPSSGFIPVGEELQIRITIKRITVRFYSTLKKRQTELRFISNAESINIIVNWHGV